ncbi:GntR family transcriptional regulator [Bacillus lacus]|uniref:GntR family transcriptional regulator n=1 Tax=Metabacillus lacus TaxID=1983721 RepID=A0A7X2IYG8_9BACI|nr:GntR family transcriptional regulator [Metabacillus lacus]MRX71949.1 GntR family transcriptional regulator [Metabacillus lacus]
MNERTVEFANSEPIYFQLYSYMKKEILDGSLSEGCKLPSKRQFSRHLGISMNTIEKAYQQLIAEGYIYSEERKGYFVSKIDESLFQDSRSVSPEIAENDNFRSCNNIEFSQGNIDLDSFPLKTWKKSVMEALKSETDSSRYKGHPQGEWELRYEIAGYLYRSRGFTCSPEEIIVGAGTQMLLVIHQKV